MRLLTLMSIIGCSDTGSPVTTDERNFINTAIALCTDAPCGIGVSIDGKIVINPGMSEAPRDRALVRSSCAMLTTTASNAGSVTGNLSPENDIVQTGVGFGCEIWGAPGALSQQAHVGDLCRLRTTVADTTTSVAITNSEKTKNWSYTFQRRE